MLSLILPKTGVEISFYLLGIAFIPLIILMWKMKNADMGTQARHKSFRTMGFGRLFKNYFFITYLCTAVFLHMPVSTSMAFLPFLIANVGGDTTKYGLVIGCRALLEIPMLLLMRPLRRKFPLPVAICGAGVLFCLEAFSYTMATNFTQIVLAQIFHGLGQGFMIGGATNYVYSLAPEGLNSTAHTVHGAVNSLASIIGNLMGGLLIVTFGIQFFYRTVVGMIMFAVLFFITTLLIGIKILKKTLPTLKAV
jgi:PPP family 3-phenylpropionic acid transporter